MKPKSGFTSQIKLRIELQNYTLAGFSFKTSLKKKEIAKFGKVANPRLNAIRNMAVLLRHRLFLVSTCTSSSSEDD